MNLQTEIYKEPEIGELPEGWDVATLRKLCKVFSGFAFRTKDFEKNGVLIVKIGNLQNGTILIDNRTSYFPKDKLNPNIEKYFLKCEDILIALTGATTGKTAIVPREHENSLLNQRVGKFEIFSEELHSLFFSYCVRTQEFKAKVIDNILKSAQGNVSPKQIENIQIPLPPLQEQKNIAHVLSKVQAAQEKTEKKIESLKELKKSAMKHLFTYGEVNLEDAENVKLKETEVGEIPEGWEVVKLGDVAQNIKQGKILSTQKIKASEMYPVYGANGIIGYYSEAFVPKNKILITCRGSTCGVVNATKQNAYVTNNAMILYENPRKVYWNFLRYALEEWDVMSLKTGSGQPQIIKGTLVHHQIPLPPLHEQKNIASILSTIDSQIQAEEKTKEAYYQLFNSLLKNLMTGKIRVNNLEFADA